MVQQNNGISITKEDITETLGNRVIQKETEITNLELQISALRRTVIELQGQVDAMTPKDDVKKK